MVNSYAGGGYFANTKKVKRAGKLLQPWHMGTHQRAHAESYLMNTNMT